MFEVSLKGQVCLITGATRGIGKAVAMTMAQADIMGMVIVDIQRDETAEETEQELASMGVDVKLVIGDASSEAVIKDAVKVCMDSWGKIDILANIAGYAATENYGVVGMKPRTATDTFLQLVGNDTNRKRGVKITFLGDGSEADVDLFVTMVYGVSLQVVAKNTIDNVRYRVEEMTGIKVNSVNIHVENITA